MANVKVVVHEEGIVQFMQENKQVRDMLVGVARSEANEAQATASDAEKGPGGRITGYADAGFSIEWQARGGKRPRVNVVSNADPMTALAAHFYTQKRDGVAHLRKALYSQTRKG